MRFRLIFCLILFTMTISACHPVDRIVDRVSLKFKNLWSSVFTAVPSANKALVNLAGLDDDALLEMFYVESYKDETPKEKRLHQAELVQVNFAMMLLESGADAKTKNESDVTALSLAEQNKRTGLVALLRSKKID